MAFPALGEAAEYMKNGTLLLSAAVLWMTLSPAQRAFAGSSPTITSLSTTSGAVGAAVTINGSSFGSTQGSSTVKFNGTAVTSVTSWSSSSIGVLVPAGATSGNIVVTVSGKSSNGEAFTVLATPEISSISPTSGAVGTSMTIYGSGFGSVYGAVFFDGSFNASISSWSDTSIVVTIPPAPTGNVTVNASGVSSNGVLFTGQPFITGVSPGAGPAGTAVSISGYNFGSSQGGSSVTFNGTAAAPTNWTSTSITVPVPSGATSGNIIVTVNSQSSNGVNFVVGSQSTAPYHLHEESGWSGIAGTDLLSFAGPDASSISIQSPSLKGTANGQTTAIEAFSATLQAPGYISAGATVSFSLWMKETSSVSGIYPYASISYLDALGNLTGLCSAAGSTALTTTLAKLQVNCTVGSAVTLSTNNRIYVQVSAINNSGGSIRRSVNADLSIEGTLNGDYDSQVTLPEVLFPFISSVSPTIGGEGSSVTISGGAFGSSQGSSNVTFNGTAATPTSWSNTSIVTPVPTGATTGPVVVSVSGQNSNSVSFSVLASITGFSPAAGPVGTAVTVSGNGFGAIQGSSTVSFNGIPAAATSWSDGSIVAPVPVGASTGPVSVTISGVVSSGGTFTVTPLVTAIAPSAGAIGASVRIRGYNFGTSAGTVTFNGIQSSLGSWVDTSIVATVPLGATSGPVVVNTGTFLSNQVNFTVVPSITSIAPTSGSSGTSVTIFGLSFGATQGASQVLFDGVPASPTSWSNTSISVPAPTGVSTGPVTIVSNGISSNGITFAAAPSIQVLSPSSGPVGTSVTISGSGFGSTQGTSWVQFAGSLATPTIWSTNKIVVPVPSGATSGLVIVAVNSNQSNGVQFTIGSGGFNGLVTNSGGGGAIAGAQIQVLQNNRVLTSSTTGADGSYTINGLAPGTYDLIASASGFGSVLSSNQSVSANGSTTANFSLSPPGTISGLVTQSGGVTPISGATVTASQGGDALGTATTDSSGNYSITNLSAGTYTATAASPGYTSQTQSGLAVSSGTTTPADFSLGGQSVITYTYDAHGRLAGASDSLGNTATYQYDAVGNLLSINQGSSSQMSIIQISPTQGPIGTTVTISGTAFSSNPAQDAVSFNGTAATVTSATTTQLVVTVPSGATTGTISVTAPSGTATSTQTFTVTSGSGRPTITSFSPGSAITGTAVTVNGTGFDTTPQNDFVIFNLKPSSVSSATATQIATTVPFGIGSGHISVRTKNGTATSANDFYVPFGSYTAASIGFAGRIPMNGTQSVSLNSAGLIALLLFDGTAGQGVSVSVSNSTFSICNVILIDPFGRQVTSGGCTGASSYIQAQSLSYSGTYTIGIDPDSRTGSANVTLNGFAPAMGISPVGFPTTISTSVPGQSATYTFGGTAGQVIDIALTNDTFSGCYSYSVSDPSSTVLISHQICGSSASTGNLTLSTTGTYTIVITPPAGGTGGVTATLTQLISQAITVNTPQSVSSTLAGQDYDLTFSGTGGQVIDLALTNDTFTGACFDYSIVNPDGSILKSAGPCSAGSSGNLTLPSTGNYSIYINSGTATGGVTVTLTQLITQAITFDTPQSVSSTLAGQEYDLTFSGTVGQIIDLALTNDTFTGACFSYSIVNPDGSTLDSHQACSATTSGNLTLPSTGTYSISINSGTATGGVSATLTQLITQAITFDTPQSVGSTLAGQEYDLTFSGTLGEVIDLVFTNDTFTGACFSYSIVNPDGSTLDSHQACSAGSSGNLTLPSTGTYSIYINSGTATGGIIATVE